MVSTPVRGADGSDAEARVWEALAGVMDPEIPMVSLVEMGVIDAVEVEGVHARIEMIPTFSGCPALDVMRHDVEEAVSAAGFAAEVVVVRRPWSTDRLAESAREKMRTIGLAPPQPHGGNVEWVMFSKLACPWCGSTDTVIENSFGPTLCRAIWYCNGCRQPFEQFKPL